MRYFLPLCSALAACFALQALALRAAGGSTRKGESNYFSSVARIQEATRGEPRVMLLGSSRTGRLPGRTRGAEGVANLGCDGASAVVALRAIARGELDPAPVLLIEGNTLYKAATEPDPGLAEAIASPWFGIGCRVPMLGATARPSSLIYNFLLERKHGSSPMPRTLPAPLTRPIRIDPRASVPLGDREEDLVEELAGIVGKLRDSGVRILIHDLPPQAPGDSPNVRVSRELARRTGVPWWDLSGAVPEGSWHYTDGIHLDPASASWVLSLLLQSMDES